jgi:hypothetical protein
MAPDLDAGVEGGICLGLELEDEVPILAFRTEKAVRAATRRCTDDLTKFYGIFGGPIALLPSV